MKRPTKTVNYGEVKSFLFFFFHHCTLRLRNALELLNLIKIRMRISERSLLELRSHISGWKKKCSIRGVILFLQRRRSLQHMGIRGRYLKLLQDVARTVAAETRQKHSPYVGTVGDVRTAE